MKEKRGPSLLKELPTGRWADRVGYHLSRGRKGDALRLLERLIEADLPLFNQSEWMARERRLAWMLRIELLLQWNRFSEALAWTCLEVEVNPANVAAAALKERLKRQLGLSPEQRRKGAEGAPRDAVTFEWKGVAGMRELKAMLERDVILPLQEPEIYERYRVSLPNGVVLYGPPGCGKTFIARNLAKKLGFHFEEIKPSSLSSTYVHGTQEKIGALFAEARKKKPCMLFFDELHRIGARITAAHAHLKILFRAIDIHRFKKIPLEPDDFLIRACLDGFYFVPGDDACFPHDTRHSRSYSRHIASQHP